MSTLDRATVEAQIIKKAMKDSAFRESLIADPKGAIEKAYGVLLPPHVKIHIHQETAHTYNLVLPAMDSSSDLEGVGNGLASDCSGWSSAAECGLECTQCGNNDTTCQPGPTEG